MLKLFILLTVFSQALDILKDNMYTLSISLKLLTILTIYYVHIVFSCSAQKPEEAGRHKQVNSHSMLALAG